MKNSRAAAGEGGFGWDLGDGDEREVLASWAPLKWAFLMDSRRPMGQLSSPWASDIRSDQRKFNVLRDFIMNYYANGTFSTHVMK